MPVLVNLRKSTHIPSVETQKIIASFNKKKAEALIISSMSQRILGNFYLKISQQINKSHPIKLFKNEDEAWEWLKQFID